MLLSEAILIGCSIRPETRVERFANTEGPAGGLRSDVWGAACEAVDRRVALLNWSAKDIHKREGAMEYLRAVQQRYFGRYFEMPAQCPGASQQYTKGRGRVINRRGDTVVEDGAKTLDAGGITSECHLVTQLAGMTDHLFYAHNWSREQVAEVVGWYEEKRTEAALAIMFTHFRSPTLEGAINHRLLQRAKASIAKRNGSQRLRAVK